MAVVRSALLSALLVAGSQAAFTITVPTVEANVTVNGDESSLRARVVVGLPGDTFIFGSAMPFVSAEAAANSANGQVTGTASVLTGVAVAPGVLGGYFPSVSLLSASASATAAISGLSSFLSGTGSPTTNVVSGVAKASAQASGVSQVYFAILEFEDANGNNKVDAGEKIVQTYSLNRSFSKGNSGSTSALLYSTVTTLDGVLSLQSYISLKDNVRVSSGKIVTPRAVSTDVYINKFPYQGNNTKIALRTFVAGFTARADASANFKLTGTTSNSLSTSQDQSIASVFASWAGSAKTQTAGNSADASANTSGNLVTVVTNVQDGNGNKNDIKVSLDADALASAGLKVSLNTVDYVFNAIQPAAVFFDPTVGAGAVLNSSAGLTATSSVAALVASLFAAYALLL